LLLSEEAKILTDWVVKNPQTTNRLQTPEELAVSERLEKIGRRYELAYVKLTVVESCCFESEHGLP